MKKLFNVIIISQLAVLLGLIGFGLYYQNKRTIDTTDYSTVKKYVDTDEYFSDEKTYRYIEERIRFSDEVESIIANMTNEEKAAQLFLTTPEQLNDLEDGYAINAGEATKNNYDEYPVAGLVFSSGNMSYYNQLYNMLNSMSAYSENRIGFDLYKIMNIEDENMLNIIYSYEQNDVPAEMDITLISDYANRRSQMMTGLGYNMLFGPLSNTADAEYSYGENSFDVLELVETEIGSYRSNNLAYAAKYFPYYDIEDKTLDDMLVDDLYIFQGLIDDGTDKIIVSNNPCPVVTGSDEICCLSGGTVDFIRARMGYDGMLISSDLSEIDGDGTAVKAIKAGMDLIYTSSDFKSMYEEVLNAINDGTISSVRLENALGRIISDKLD